MTKEKYNLKDEIEFRLYYALENHPTEQDNERMRNTIYDLIKNEKKELKKRIIQEVYNIMGDTLSVDTTKSHREVQEMYAKLLKLEANKGGK